VYRFDAATAIRQEETKRGLVSTTDRVVMVALSATVTPDVATHCYNAGFDHSMSKPVKREKLTKSLSDWVAVRRAAQASHTEKYKKSKRK
jgi:CheY-like chemotaxis protein